MSFCEEIKSPFDNVETLRRLLEIYVNGKVDNGTKPIEHGEDIMGFHVSPQTLQVDSNMEEMVKGELKFYINAGTDTYRFASLFQERCESLNLNYYFKVVNADQSEYKRKDKMCIYVDLENAEIFLKIIKDLMAKNPDIKFEEPPLLAGRIGIFIGIGTDQMIQALSDGSR